MKQISHKIIVVPRIWNEKHKAYLDDNTFSGKIPVFLFDEIRAKNNKTIRSFFLIIIVANQMSGYQINV